MAEYMYRIDADDLRRALLVERYGPLREMEKERPPAPAEIQRRRRILNGDDHEERR